MKKYSAVFTLRTSYDTIIEVRGTEDGIELVHIGNGTQEQKITFTSYEVDDLIGMLKDAKANIE